MNFVVRQNRRLHPEIMKILITGAVGDRTTLNQLYEQLLINLLPSYPHLQGVQLVYRDFRAGDVRHSRWPTSEKLLPTLVIDPRTGLTRG